MHVLDYASFRDVVVEAVKQKELQVSVDEAVFLNSASRGCEVFVHPLEEPAEVWGKISFEWVAENQALLEELQGDGAPDEFDVTADPAAEVMMHVSFHLHLGSLSIATEIVREVAEEIKNQAEAFFGDEGGVIAEVSMTSAEARLECLRFEVNTSAPFATEESWWAQLGEVSLFMLDKLRDILSRLSSEYGSPRGAAE